ncbi:MAG: glycosyl transferase family 1 [Gammaproteobacteria bacterium HGW-Gammaproteobacteria-3]|nr:MAG: glycosyl transferase family 1 [Gammaproteobacteria bacterium HGW-Gammaproteobacteria-3]
MSQNEKVLNIGLIGPLPPPFGGMANQTKQLQQLLLDEGIPVTMVQTNAPYPHETIGKIRGVRALGRMLPYLLSVWKTTSRVDVLHVMANSGWSWQLFAAPVIWIAWLKKKPVIINYRGGEAENYFKKSIRRVRPSMNKAAIIVVPSGYLKKVFADFGFVTEVIPNIINLERFLPKNNKHFNKDAPHLIITRNLEAIYGIKIALEAIASLKQQYPEIKLSIAGSGPQKEELQQLTQQLGIAENVIFTGKLAPETIAELYQSADIMLNPTTVDNMPNSVLEALASGVPVVSTDVGGIPYIVKDGVTALLTKVDDAFFMAAQINRLLNDTALYETLVVNGLQEVQQYAWSHVKYQWLGLYRSFVEPS